MYMYMLCIYTVHVYFVCMHTLDCDVTHVCMHYGNVCRSCVLHLFIFDVMQ